jgi:hypothetical protein
VAGEQRVWDQIIGYDPITATWRAGALPPFGFRTLDPVWTGSMLLFVNGNDHAVAYVSATDTWLMLPDNENPSREFASSVWSGRALLSWGGVLGEMGVFPQDGVIFTPEWVPQGLR